MTIDRDALSFWREAYFIAFTDAVKRRHEGVFRPNDIADQAASLADSSLSVYLWERGQNAGAAHRRQPKPSRRRQKGK